MADESRAYLLSPAQHYQEAGRLLALADTDVSENWPPRCGETKADILAAAQAHALLASAPWPTYQQARDMAREATAPSDDASTPDRGLPDDR